MGIDAGLLSNEYLNLRMKFPLEVLFSLQELVYKILYSMLGAE